MRKLVVRKWELENIHSLITTALRNNAPKRYNLAEVGDQIIKANIAFTEQQKELFNKSVKKDKEGNPIVKKGVKAPKQFTDYELLVDPKVVTDELNKLAQEELTLEYKPVKKEEPILVTVDGKASKMPLYDYLNDTAGNPEITQISHLFYILYWADAK